jgi:hypothetical protein
MMFKPRWPSAGPIGGDGLALPAGTCSLTKPTIFFAMLFLLAGDNALTLSLSYRPWLPGVNDSPTYFVRIESENANDLSNF